MKQIDLGGLSFVELREGGKYYVDKTMLLADILGTNDRGVYLFTRPRRFGKTTNLLMMDAFLNMEYKGNDWFDDLEITEHPEFDRYKNRFPVIRIDMGLCKEPSYESFINMFKAVIHDTFNRHGYLLKSDEATFRVRQLFASLNDRSVSEDDLKTSIKDLSEALTIFHGVKPVILIDEYDRAIADSFGSPIYRSLMDFISSFMYATIKGNENRQMVYVTGVMQIAKESIFSGLNNIMVDNIFSTISDERFGFTESEVRALLSYYGHLDEFHIVKEWYDGYRFGDAEVYNPYSIMSYVSKRNGPDEYWSNTATDVVIDWLLDRIDMGTFSQISTLINGGSIEVKLNDTMTYDELGSRINSLFSLMAMSGYLKAVPKGNKVFEISIPNKEVMSIVNNKVENLDLIDNGIFQKFNTAILDGDSDSIASILQSVLKDASYMTLKDEHDYQLVLMTLMHALAQRYSVRTEYEAGNGRLDMILKPLREGMMPLIFELKRVGAEAELDGATEDAIAQIHRQRYYLDMSGDVVLFGMAFWGKVPKVSVERITVRNGSLIQRPGDNRY